MVIKPRSLSCTITSGRLRQRPGGLCTAWHRQGFVFDGYIHYLFGSAPGQPFYQLWEELGVVPQQQFVHHDELLRVSESDGKTLIVYSNPDRLEQHLKELSPIDRRLTSDFCAGIRTFAHFDLSLLQQQPKALMQLGDWGKLVRKMLPFICPLARWGNLSAAEFADTLPTTGITGRKSRSISRTALDYSFARSTCRNCRGKAV
jgi:phytoene dehydrogenase-like protein